MIRKLISRYRSGRAIERAVGRVYTGDLRVDQLYDVEDFLRNIGEPKRAEAVQGARLLLKYQMAALDEWAAVYEGGKCSG